MILRFLDRYQYEWRTNSVMDAAMATAAEMVEEKIQTYPRVSRIIQKFDPKACQALTQFLVPERMHILSLGGIPAPAEWNPTPEPWYKGVFALEKIPQMILFNLQALD